MDTNDNETTTNSYHTIQRRQRRRISNNDTNNSTGEEEVESSLMDEVMEEEEDNASSSPAMMMTTMTTTTALGEGTPLIGDAASREEEEEEEEEGDEDYDEAIRTPTPSVIASDEEGNLNNIIIDGSDDVGIASSSPSSGEGDNDIDAMGGGGGGAGTGGGGVGAGGGGSSSSTAQRKLLIHSTPTLASISHPIKSRVVREIGHEAVWSLSTAKPGNGVEQIRDSSMDTYWQSDGGQPHLINIQFSKRAAVCEVAFYLDYNLDESYTPKCLSVWAGTTFHDLIEIKRVELSEPVGWCSVPLRRIPGDDPLDDPRDVWYGASSAFDDADHDEDDDDEDDDEDEDDEEGWSRKKKRRGPPIRAHFVQICVTSMHQNGRDTHIRQVKIFGPRSGDGLQTQRRAMVSSTQQQQQEQQQQQQRRRLQQQQQRRQKLGVAQQIRQKEEEEMKQRPSNMGPVDDGLGLPWTCSVPKFRTVEMSQFSTIR